MHSKLNTNNTIFTSSVARSKDSSCYPGSMQKKLESRNSIYFTEENLSNQFSIMEHSNIRDLYSPIIEETPIKLSTSDNNLNLITLQSSDQKSNSIMPSHGGGLFPRINESLLNAKPSTPLYLNTKNYFRKLKITEPIFFEPWRIRAKFQLSDFLQGILKKYENKNFNYASDSFNTLIFDKKSSKNFSLLNSIELSIKNLNSRYYEYQLFIPSIKENIKNYIWKCSLSNSEKNNILSFLSNLSPSESRINGDLYNIEEILCLVWQGINDENPDIIESPLSANDLDHRKNILLQNIITAQTNNYDLADTLSCLLLSLDRVHRDVYICRPESEKEIGTRARISVTQDIEKYLYELLHASPSEELYNETQLWEKNEKQDETEFIQTLNNNAPNSLKIYLANKLNEDFGILLNNEQQNIIINELIIEALNCLQNRAIDIRARMSKVSNINHNIISLFTAVIQRVRRTDFKSALAKFRKTPDLNKKVPNHVYSIYKICKNALVDYSLIENNEEMWYEKNTVTSKAVEAIMKELQDARNGENWSRSNRSSITTSFYEKLHTFLSIYV